LWHYCVNILPESIHVVDSDCIKLQLLSCIALTEVGHGSNTKQIRTTATYDPATQEFVIHTPDFQAAKCWAGNLGECEFGIGVLFACGGGGGGGGGGRRRRRRRKKKT
jgi:alkylation response protein AidB-like acyl-CoA dehydrogenase